MITVGTSAFKYLYRETGIDLFDKAIAGYITNEQDQGKEPLPAHNTVWLDKQARAYDLYEATDNNGGYSVAPSTWTKRNTVPLELVTQVIRPVGGSNMLGKTGIFKVARGNRNDRAKVWKEAGMMFFATDTNTLSIYNDKTGEWTEFFPTLQSTDAMIGVIIRWAGRNVPQGFLKCDGSVFDRNTYPELYDVLGTNILPIEDGSIIRAGA